MDYSPDEVLTHFSESQKRLMHYFIIIFKSYLINNSVKLKSNLLSNQVKYYVNQNITLEIVNDNKNNSININKTSNTIEYIIEYNLENIFEFKIK